MNLQLIIAAIIALCSFGSAWQIQSWRIDAKEKDHVEQTLREQQQRAATELRLQTAVASAQSAATNRLRQLRNDADGARYAVAGLHDAAATALREAENSHAACLERAATAAELLNTSAGAYQDLAAKADRHANDVKTLTDAWPTESKVDQ